MNIITQLLRTIIQKLQKKGLDQFSYDLGLRESGNNYLIKNSLGYLGRWQFGLARLCDYGIVIDDGYSYKWKKGYSEEIFLNSPALQDKVFKWHIEDLKKRIGIGFAKYLNKEVNGVYFDLSGGIAGAHLSGIGGIIDFINNQNKVDAYGTTVKDYIQQFSGYKL
jgi:hypothetical protein